MAPGAASLASRRVSMRAGAARFLNRLDHALAKNDEADADGLYAVKQAQRTLAVERSEAFAALEIAPERIALGEVQFLLHSLAVLAAASDEVERHDERIEEMAVCIASALLSRFPPSR